MNSPQERENLRKRLQKLFAKQESLKHATSKPNENRQTNYIQANSIKKNNKVSKEQQAKETNTVKKNSKNLKKKQKSQEKSQTDSKVASKQTGFVKAPDQQKFHKRNKKLEDSVLKQGKKTETKIQKDKNSTANKTNEKHSSKQQSRPINPKSSQQKHNKMHKPQKMDKTSKSKKTVNITKDAQKIKNKNFGNSPRRNASKTDQTTSKENNDTKFNQRLKKKSRKRTASTGALSNESVLSKQQKLTEQKTKFEDEFDANSITGYVRGGDFDSDYKNDDMENNYWMQQESYSENESESNGTMHNFKEQYHVDLEKYVQDESSDGGEHYSDSDDEYHNCDDCCDSYEEEEENYYDLDGNDYEEDDYRFNYFTNDDNDHSSNFDDYDHDMSYDFNDEDSDYDYELPKHVPEDLIIQKGTAVKRDLKAEDNVSFDRENQGLHIVELENQCNVKVVCQPKAYEREELLELTYEKKSLSALKPFKKSTPLNDTEECPKLVPIVDEDGFQLYNLNEDVFDYSIEEEYENDSMDSVKLDSDYTEISSDEADSFLSEDINEKYLNRSHDDIDSDNSIDENVWNKAHNVEVIDARDCKFEVETINSNDQSNSSFLNDDISQIPPLKFYDNVDLKTECSIISTKIIDNKIFMPNDISLGDQINAAQEESSNKSETSLIEEDIAIQDDEVMGNLQREKENETEPLPKVVKSTGKNPDNYNTNFFNAFNSNIVMVLLKDPLYIYGTVRLTLLSGIVEVYGHPLSLNTEVEIFSPRGCSVIEISPSNTKKHICKENLQEILKPYEQYFALADLNKVASLYNGETDAVVLLKRNEARKKVVQQFKKFMNENVFPNINNINIDRSLYNSEYLLRCMINTSAEEQKCLRLPKQWQELSITSKSRVMLAGGKSVGKSTLLRYLINRHLSQKVLLIDLDIGQPEVFIPQTISCTILEQPLLGPGFFLNIQPDMAYVVGHTNIILCADKYIAAARSLIAYCKAQEDYKEIPWLINTMGYNKGFGLELMSVIAHELPLTDLIQIQSAKDINNFDSILQPHVLSSQPRIFFAKESVDEENIKEKLNYRLHVWQSAVEQKSRYQKEWEMSAKDLRFSMFLSRLSEALQGHADWLTDIKPYSASYNELKIVNLTDNTPSASMEQLVKAVEASLVYLCHYEEDLKPLKCLGIGVVRAIDFNVQQLYLIPALPDTQLKEFNCLAIGEFPLPTSLFTNQGPRVKNIAPFVYNTISANASKAIKQIYHRPRTFLMGKHKLLD